MLQYEHMYGIHDIIQFQEQNNGLPMVSRRELDIACEDLARFLQEEHFHGNPDATNITLLMQILREEGWSYFGRYPAQSNLLGGCFEKGGQFTVLSEDRRKYEKLQIPAHSILINKNLYQREKQFQFRFVLAHEIGHALMHEDFSSSSENMKEYASGLQIRMDGDEVFTNRQEGRLRSAYDWMEWQANTFASCLLMPRRLVMEVTSLVCELEFECKEGAKQTDKERKEEAVFLTALQDKLFADHQLASELLVTIKDVFRVSESAAFYRLRSLNLLPEESQLLPSGIVVY